MVSRLLSRRTFIGSSASALALFSFPGVLRAQATIRFRLEWQQFKTTPQYASFVNAVRKMKASNNSSSPLFVGLLDECPCV